MTIYVYKAREKQQDYLWVGEVRNSLIVPN